MTSKVLFKIAMATVLAGLFAGCSTPQKLRNGKYNGGNIYSNSFACVYEDTMFIRLRKPDDAVGQGNHWDWAGKFEVDKNGQIELAMEGDDKRIWNFYFELYANDGMIVIEDNSRGGKYALVHEDGNAPVRQDGAGGAQYQPLQ